MLESEKFADAGIQRETHPPTTKDLSGYGTRKFLNLSANNALLTLKIARTQRMTSAARVGTKPQFTVELRPL